MPAERVWYEPAKPFPVAPAGRDGAPRPTCSTSTTCSGKRVGRDARTTAGSPSREENAAAALEVMSRFAVDPRWLLYLPPTMAPAATSTRDGLLEHPARGVRGLPPPTASTQVVCEEKHMGSRAVVLVCRDDAVAARGSARRTARPARSTPAPAGRSSTGR